MQEIRRVAYTVAPVQPARAAMEAMRSAAAPAHGSGRTFISLQVGRDGSMQCGYAIFASIFIAYNHLYISAGAYFCQDFTNLHLLFTPPCHALTSWLR